MCHRSQQHSSVDLKLLMPWEFGGGGHCSGLLHLGCFVGRGPSRIAEQLPFPASMPHHPQTGGHRTLVTIARTGKAMSHW